MRKLTLTFHEWQIDEATQLGRAGGFGSVFVGSGTDGQAVAIKLINLDVGDAAQRELEFAKAFVGRRTQNIIPILDFGVDTITKRSCIVMARAEESLRDTIAKGPINQSEAINIVSQIARGLLEADDWIHRDLKPENILKLDAFWRIADFGIARMAEASTATLTFKDALSPQYAAPEQWTGITAAHSTDIYALGGIAIELLTGSPPFPGPEIEDYARQHQSEMPTIDAIAPYLRALIFRMVAKPMVARPTAEKVFAELQYFNAHPQGSGAGANKLAAVSAVIAERTARAEAIELARIARLEQRRALGEHASSILLGVAERLFAEITQHAPAAKVSKNRQGHVTVYEATLGPGTIRLTLGNFGIIAPEVFDGSNWDVICGDIILIGNSTYSRSASLWYADIQKNGNFEWIEAAYWMLRQGIPAAQRDKLMLAKQIANEPCSLPPGHEAAQAAFQGMRAWNLAYNPRPIEGPATDDFCQRWMDYFAQAVDGSLRPPSRFPEEALRPLNLG